MMESRLAAHDWLVGKTPTVADLCLYAYTHTAEEKGGFDLSPFPGVRAWLARVAALPGYVGLTDMPA
jgi:glutathione S-transferase